MLPVTVNFRRTLITGLVLLAVSLIGSLSINAVLSGVHQTELLANVPNSLVAVSSFLLLTVQLVGALLVAIAVLDRLSRHAKSEEDRTETGDAEQQSMKATP